MADDTTNRGPLDCPRIGLSEDYEVRYWSEKFGVTKEQQAAVVKAAGSSPAAVAQAPGTSP